MMQSAVAMAAVQEQKQLAESAAADQLADPLARAKSKFGG